MSSKRVVINLILFFFYIYNCKAQQADVEVMVSVIHSLRALEEVYPDAQQLVKRVIRKDNFRRYDELPVDQYSIYEKISADMVGERKSLYSGLNELKVKNYRFYRRYIFPFEKWLYYAADDSATDALSLTTLLYEDYYYYERIGERKKWKENHLSISEKSLYDIVSRHDISSFLGEILPDINVYAKKSRLMLLDFENPLSPQGSNIYTYKCMGSRTIEGKEHSEIYFFCKNPNKNAFSGFMYISNEPVPFVRKIVFTINNPDNLNFVRNLLFTYEFKQAGTFTIPVYKEGVLLVGDADKGGIMVKKTTVFELPEEDLQNKAPGSPGENIMDLDIRPVPLTASEEKIDSFLNLVPENKVFSNANNLLAVFLTRHIQVGGLNGKVELGPVLQTVSYNDMEGVRLRIGGNTKVPFINKMMIGGYVAYGLQDELWKYRGDLTWSFHKREKYIWEYPRKLLSFTYVNDLNIPGQDLLASVRDELGYSLSHSSTNNMSSQKIALLSFENENKKNISYKISGKYTYDKPVGIVNYIRQTEDKTEVIRYLTTTEFGLSLRYAPSESYIQVREKRILIHRGDFDVHFNHRVGIKGLFNSDYNYQITDFKINKNINFSNNTGSMEMRLSGGKVWNKVPFPLLFIPIGNQSYIYEKENFNALNFYEFTTDRFLAANTDILFNWSVIRFIAPSDKIKTAVGGRIIYGPLSNLNNPELNKSLFVFNNGVKPLDNIPYAEVNAGLSNIFKILEIQYIRRLTYLNDDTNDHRNNLIKGSVLFNLRFAF